MLMFVAIVNKIRAGAFAPRWDELKEIKPAQRRSRPLPAPRGHQAPVG
jgi:hypothetical protein